jgi:membrane protease YdiL (CAAX protease family)
MTVTHLIKEQIKCQESSNDYFKSVTWFKSGENQNQDGDSRSVPLLPGGASRERRAVSPASKSLFSNFVCKSRFTSSSHSSTSRNRFGIDSTAASASAAEMGFGFKVLASENSPASEAASNPNEEGLIIPRVKSAHIVDDNAPEFVCLSAAIVGCGPTFAVVIWGLALHEMIAAMLIMHTIAMICSPLLHIWLLRGNSREVCEHYWQQSTVDFRNGWPHFLSRFTAGLIAWVVIAIVGFGISLLATCRAMSWEFCVHNMWPNLDRYGIDEDYPLSYLYLIGAYFVVVNPIIEEIFWRVWLLGEFGATLFKQKVSDLDVEDPLNPPNQIDYTVSAGVSEKGQWLGAAQYAFYHFFVVGVLLNWYWATAGFFGLTVLGRVLSYVKEHRHGGVLLAVLIHSGVDFVVIAVMFNMRFHTIDIRLDQL